MKPGDLIQITFIDNTKIYKIYKTTHNKIEIFLLVDPSDRQNLIYKDGGWIHSSCDPRYKIIFLDTHIYRSTFSHVPYDDLLKLIKLDDSLITMICRVNKYIDKIYNDDKLWRILIKRTFVSLYYEIHQ